MFRVDGAIPIAVGHGVTLSMKRIPLPTLNKLTQWGEANNGFAPLVGPRGGGTRDSDCDALAQACAQQGRWEFFFSVAPWRFRGATGDVVNLLAIF